MTQHLTPAEVAHALFNPAKLVDELGLVKAQIAELEAREAALTAALVDAGQVDYAGTFYDAHVGKEQTRTTANRKAIEKDLGELPAEYLTVSKPFRVVTCTAKK